MTVDQRALLRDLQQQVRLLEDDVRDRAAADPEVDERLRAEHAQALKVGRTAATFTEWRDGQVVQAAVAWVLATVFVRFCEDNHLVDDPWLAGPGERLREAGERQTQLLVSQPHLNDRDWLLAAFDHLATLPAVAALLDREHNPLHRLAISADGAEALVAFWRRRGDDGTLVHDFTDADLSTRFLGDLYQDLSEAARKAFALLQTPDFVEEFILDLTLTPAIDTFGLDGLKLIDPTCGSGHFLLGAFDRLLEAWSRKAPGMDRRERVQRALDSVHGVDVNPFATAIAKFRLTVAALKASGLERLKDAPGYQLHVGTGDSLLHGKHDGELFDSGLGDHQYASEDLDEHPGILARGRYHVVVGNPPYITVKDKSLSDAYRAGYESCHRQYALSVPFAELLFRLAKRDPESPGFVGQITSNSFAKREFGKRLVEVFFRRVHLTHVVDTSGAYIPGHGTPTVILIGRNRTPQVSLVRAVLGRRGEPSQPVIPARGLVWDSIVRNIAQSDFENEYVSVVDARRDDFERHPWSLSGGGSASLLALLEARSIGTLGPAVDRIGFMAMSHADESFTIPNDLVGRHPEWERDYLPSLVSGEGVRDYQLSTRDATWFPYDGDRLIDIENAPELSRWLWAHRTELGNRSAFEGSYFVIGRRWWEWHQYPSAGESRRVLTWAEITTHNHFALSETGPVFKQTAPIIRMDETADVDWQLRLLGFLNSSTACFWLKEMCFDKGNGGIGGGISDERWEHRFAFNSTTVGKLPLPKSLPPSNLVESIIKSTATAAAALNGLGAGKAVARALEDAREKYETARELSVAFQEEIDWSVYKSFGFVDEDLVYKGKGLPRVRLGERAFEIALGRALDSGNTETVWFERHRSTSIVEIPERWPGEYQDIVRRRLELIESNPHLRLLERPDCKRRWADEPWDVKESRALQEWLLGRLERRELWHDPSGRPVVQSVAQLSGRLASDSDFLEVLELWAAQSAPDVAREVGRLVADEHVPFLAAMRYKPSGLRKRAAWEETWALQRREDAGEDVGDIAVPPRYTTADFVRTSYWKHRGKLDVPKERFVSYPGAERGADTSMVLGWAGWDHAQQALALATLVVQRQQTDGWGADKVVPLLAGVAELEPWVLQWHGDVDPRMGTSPAQAVSATLEQQLARHGLTREQLAEWRPPPAARGRRPRASQED